MRHQVEHRRRPAQRPQRQHHQPQVRHRGIRQNAFQIGGHQRNRCRPQRRYHPHAGHGQQRRRRGRKYRIRPRHQIDAGNYHRCGVNQGAYRRGPLHSIGQPHMKGELRRLAHRPQQQQQRRRRSYAAAQFPGRRRRKSLRHTETAHIHPQQQDAHQQPHISDARHYEGFFGGLPRPRLLKPEPDEQVRTQPHQFPGDVQQQKIVRQRQRQHRRHKQRLPGVVPPKTRVALHIFQRIQLHPQRHKGNQPQQDDGQRVNQHPPAQPDGGVNAGAAGYPRLKPGDTEMAGEGMGNPVDAARRVRLRRPQESRRGRHPHRKAAGNRQQGQRRPPQRQPPLEKHNQRARRKGKDRYQKGQRHRQFTRQAPAPTTSAG